MRKHYNKADYKTPAIESLIQDIAIRLSNECRLTPHNAVKLSRKFVHSRSSQINQFCYKHHHDSECTYSLILKYHLTRKWISCHADNDPSPSSFDNLEHRGFDWL